VELVADHAPNAAAALDGYIGEKERWIAAVKTGGYSPDNVIAVETSSGSAPLEPAPELADDLSRRLQFLDEEVFAYHRDDLDVGRPGTER
jgi:hypothetical protein